MNSSSHRGTPVRTSRPVLLLAISAASLAAPVAARAQSRQRVSLQVSSEYVRGTSLLQVAKAASPSTIRIMLTGYPSDGWLRAAEENGLMRVCTKPWDDGELRQIIREELELANPPA